MAKKKVAPKPTTNVDPLVLNEYIASRASLARLMNSVYDDNRNLNTSCHYPEEITDTMYREMYKREGIGARVVNIFPEKCWQVDPSVEENAEGDATEFETAVLDLVNEKNIWHYLARIDGLSGIANYGVLLLGIDDGKDIGQPVDGINEDGMKEGDAEHNLLYLRTFDQTQAKILEYNDDATSPRFGQPTLYEIEFFKPGQSSASVNANPKVKVLKVHWSRCIHIADNRHTSETFGTPRMESGFNRLLDLRKTLGGSAEMYWKGAFPGVFLEMNDTDELTTAEKEALKEEILNYTNDLQRTLALRNVKASSISPQVVSPKDQFETQLKALAITCGIPLRIFAGNEAGELASSQDEKNFNGTLAYRQNKYLAPMVIRPVIDRFIAFGILPEPEKYVVTWPDMNEDTPDAIAERGVKLVKMMVEYVKGGAENIMDRMDFLTKVMGYSSEEAEAIIEKVDNAIIEDTEGDDYGIAEGEDG
ncbi:MAG: DUF1073 domain-containing protein [FCB group bacterium]|nr:DUF1073 domain-containing protein [FCB group bacterium]